MSRRAAILRGPRWFSLTAVTAMVHSVIEGSLVRFDLPGAATVQAGRVNRPRHWQVKKGYGFRRRAGACDRRLTPPLASAAAQGERR